MRNRDSCILNILTLLKPAFRSLGLCHQNNKKGLHKIQKKTIWSQKFDWGLVLTSHYSKVFRFFLTPRSVENLREKNYIPKKDHTKKFIVTKTQELNIYNIQFFLSFSSVKYYTDQEYGFRWSLPLTNVKALFLCTFMIILRF